MLCVSSHCASKAPIQASSLDGCPHESLLKGTEKHFQAPRTHTHNIPLLQVNSVSNLLLAGVPALWQEKEMARPTGFEPVASCSGGTFRHALNRHKSLRYNAQQHR